MLTMHRFKRVYVTVTKKGVFKMTEKKFDEAAVLKLRGEIETTFREFLIDSAEPTVKAQARRARKRSSELAKMLKQYREISIK